MDKRTIRDVDYAGRRVLVRVDFNVPLEDGNITDDTRIESALPTIHALVDEGARVVLCSHLGRPGGEPDSELSLQPAADRLGEMVEAPVRMAPDCIGDEVAGMRAELGEGEILVLENTRFRPGEEANDDDFAEQLAGDAELYVDDAFGSMHRAHASTVGVTQFISDCVAGLLVEEELKRLEPCREASGDGFIVILGGAKVEEKIKAISQLLPRAERLLIGGAMAWAFLKARGLEIGESLCEDESLEAAREIEAEMADLLDRMILPADVHIRQVKPDTGQTKYVPVTEMGPGWDGLDIGPETQSRFAQMVQDAEIVFWNGPMGYFERKPFDEGTRVVAAALAETDAYTAVGGGDSVAAITEMGFEDDMSHISTGGGASLEFVQGDDLPGVEALDDK